MRTVHIVIIASALWAALPGLYATCALAAILPGTPVWEVRQEPDGENASSQGRAVALDPEGNMLVTGFVEAADGNYDIATYKYSPEGELVWSRRYDYSWYDVGTAVASDPAGNVIVAGASQNLDRPIDIYLKTYYTDYVVLKYSPGGELVFEAAASGNGKNNEPKAVCVDPSGGIYVTGAAKDATGTRNTYYTVKFDPSGEMAWERVEDWGTEAAATGVGISPDGVVVTGYVLDAEQSNYDIITLIYSSESGDVAALSMYRAPGSYFDEKAYGLAVDAEGYVYITGATSDEGGVTLTLKLDPELKPVWAEPFYVLQAENEGRSAGVDEHGRVFVAGGTDGDSPAGALLVLVYGPDGLIFDFRSVEVEDGFTVEEMVVEPDGDLVVTGTSYEQAGRETAGARPVKTAVMSTMRLAGYPPPNPHGRFDLEEKLVRGEVLSLNLPPARMLRKVSLTMNTVVLRGCLPTAVFVAEPGVPGDYEYSFFVTRGEGLVWEKVRDYSPVRSFALAPRVGRDAVTGVMVQAREKGSTMEYQAREYIWLDTE